MVVILWMAVCIPAEIAVRWASRRWPQLNLRAWWALAWAFANVTIAALLFAGISGFWGSSVVWAWVLLMLTPTAVMEWWQRLHGTLPPLPSWAMGDRWWQRVFRAVVRGD